MNFSTAQVHDATERLAKHWAGRMMSQHDRSTVVHVVAKHLSQRSDGLRFREAVRAELAEEYSSIWLLVLMNVVVPLLVKWLLNRRTDP